MDGKRASNTHQGIRRLPDNRRGRCCDREGPISVHRAYRTSHLEFGVGDSMKRPRTTLAIVLTIASAVTALAITLAPSAIAATSNDANTPAATAAVPADGGAQECSPGVTISPMKVPDGMDPFTATNAEPAPASSRCAARAGLVLDVHVLALVPRRRQQALPGRASMPPRRQG
jgi:hypothetical protein